MERRMTTSMSTGAVEVREVALPLPKAFFPSTM